MSHPDHPQDAWRGWLPFARDVRDGRVQGAGRPDHRCGQHRHRRVRPWPRDGDPCAGPVSRRPARALRRLNVDGAHIADDGAAGAEPGNDVGDRRLQDLHHHRDDDQCRNRASAGWRQRSQPGRPIRRRLHRGDKTAAYGIDPARFSASRIGSAGAIRCGGRSALQLMIAIGPEAFPMTFLAGGRAMDQHFLTAPFRRRTCRCMLALVGIWHNQICGHATRAVLAL
jgi:glucose-6-phosphate isomerase